MPFPLTCSQQLWYSASKTAKQKGWGCPASLIFGSQIPGGGELLDLGPGLSLRGDSGGRIWIQGHPGCL